MIGWMGFILTGCGEEGGAVYTGTSVSPSPSEPIYLIEIMKKNGLNAADPQRSSYICYFDDNDEWIQFMILKDGGGFFQAQGEPRSYRGWKMNKYDGEITFYVYPNGSDLSTISDITLNSNQTLKSGFFYSVDEGTTRPFSDCYYDSSPGF